MKSATRENLLSRIFEKHSEPEFNELALSVFYYQATNNPVYRKYINHLKKDIGSVSKIQDIPFLPVEIFKTEKVLTLFNDADLIFSSSSTSSAIPGKHFVPDPHVYEKSFLEAFNLFYGDPKDYCILALLPSYLERSGSSLIFMMERLIKESNNKLSGFYLHNHAELSEVLQSLQASGKKTLLIGVTFALIDFAEKFPIQFPDLIVMETGGMKGRREELVREELHTLLKNGFGLKQIHSEYGMTELLSQAYSKSDGLFQCPPWMKVMIREPNDPFSILELGKSGGINIIDLANIDSCSFIETQDLGKINSAGCFEVLGRFDHSDLRGCNLMVL